MDAHRRRLLVVVLKVSLAVAILAFLFVRLAKEDAIERLIHQPKAWDVLLLAQVCVLAGFAISCVRWCVLVRGLGFEFPLSNAFRLGALGFLLSQVSLGSIGGDLFKAMFLAREQPERKTHAVATVVIDRVVGLYAMLLVCSCGLVAAGGWSVAHPVLGTLATVVAIATVVLTVGLGIVLTPAASSERVKETAAGLPLVGGTIERLVDAAAMYRTHRRSLYLAILLGICTHCLLITGIWSISRAIPINAPALTDMVLIAPMSLFVGAIPATPGGLGTFEATMEFLYLIVGGQEGDGTVAALTYRVATYVVASIGGIYYAASRSGIGDAIHQAEELVESGVPEPTSDEMI